MKKQEVLPTKDSESQDKNHVHVQTNIINIAQYVDVEKIESLSKTDTKLANRYLDIIEEQLKQASKTDDKILQIEQKEQELKQTELPHQRKYAFRSLYFSFAIGAIGMGLSAYALYLNQPWVASAAITIPVGILAVNLLGIRNKDQG